jgi:hypothetical protein
MNRIAIASTIWRRGMSAGARPSAGANGVD